MTLKEIKAKQLELYIEIQDLQVVEIKNNLTVSEQNHLNKLRNNHTELGKLIPAAEIEEKRELFGDEYANLYSEKQEILSRKGVQLFEVLKRRQEIDKLLSEIEKQKGLTK